jgi:hypothetical protein
MEYPQTRIQKTLVMNKKLEEIFEKNSNSNFILDKEAVFKSMEESYQLGINEVLDWLHQMDYVTDKINYIIEEWNNQHNNKS